MNERDEAALDVFDPAVRRRALERICAATTWPAPSEIVNLHCHTFYSYNAYGYSPTHFAVLARKCGVAVAGIVDFDVLDGLDEFQAASHAVGLKAVVSLESRVFVPELADMVVNSPGEPGIAYHMGVGFPRPVGHPFLATMRATAEQRIRDTLGRVNAYLRPVELDFEHDVLPLTPRGNVTERHLCEAFELKAQQVFPDAGDRSLFWLEKLGDAPAEGLELQNLLRARTLKKGGVGYTRPQAGAFPLMADMNRFTLDAGAIPTLAWLDGTSEGERSGERLLDVAGSTGVAALNIIPDRNYTPGVEDEKLRNLYEIVALAERRGLPIVVGTEMNAPGNKFVDSFETAELKPLLPVFLKGAHIVYAHSMLQRESGLGYLSSWAATTFASVAAKNEFFETVGRRLDPVSEGRLAALPAYAAPEQILAALPSSSN
ncbi:MAG: hypothetical protein ACXVRK_16485 [Gaiellaceae bacterium]